MVNGENGVGMYKIATSFLLGVVLTGIGAYFSSQKDFITRREFSEQNARYDGHFEANDKQIGQLIQSMQQTTNDVTRVTEDLRITAKPLPPR